MAAEFLASRKATVYRICDSTAAATGCGAAAGTSSLSRAKYGPR